MRLRITAGMRVAVSTAESATVCAVAAASCGDVANHSPATVVPAAGNAVVILADAFARIKTAAQEPALRAFAATAVAAASVVATPVVATVCVARALVAEAVDKTAGRANTTIAADLWPWSALRLDNVASVAASVGQPTCLGASTSCDAQQSRPRKDLVH